MGFQFRDAHTFSVEGIGPDGVRTRIGTTTSLDHHERPEDRKRWVIDPWCGIPELDRYPDPVSAAIRLGEIHREWFHNPDNRPSCNKTVYEKLSTDQGRGEAHAKVGGGARGLES